MRRCFFVRAALVGATFALVPAAAVETVKDSARAPGFCMSGASALPAGAARELPIGNYRGPRASSNEKAQRFFDQGLVFGWGFNFPESVRSFRAAARLDLDCALCRWGIAWSLGPSINHDMQAADVPIALDALVQARVIAKPGSRDRLLIDALSERYADRPGVRTEQLAQNYARAMRALTDRHADDADIAVLAAEAMMNQHAYDYWRKNGTPQPWTPEIVEMLEKALRLAPTHPGAHHYRIHLYEDSRQPELALASAEQLGALTPIVGHLVHMPSHVFFRLGRYRDATVANDAAVRADREYAALAGNESDYALHHLHFLWASALWSGERDTALRVADQLATAAASPSTNGSDGRDGTRQHLLSAPDLTLVRFGLWQELAARVDLGAASGPYQRGLTQFAAGIAHAKRGDVALARNKLAALRRSARDTAAAALTVKNINRAADVLSIARALLQSAIASARGAHSDAVRDARAAVIAEDRLESDDPPAWPLPARHVLAAALLHAGRAHEAARTYRADLDRYPDNCIARIGLAAAERKRSSTVSLQPPARSAAPPPQCFE